MEKIFDNFSFPPLCKLPNLAWKKELFVYLYVVIKEGRKDAKSF